MISSKWKVLKACAGHTLLWSAGCVTLIAIVWTITLTKIKNERTEAEKAVYTLATAYSRAYAEQLERTIAQIEQLTLQLQYQWSKSDAAVSLEEQFQFGLFPRSGQIYVSIVDRSGKGVTSTLPGRPLDAADTDYFKFHRRYADGRLRIESRLFHGRRINAPILRFTRRLEAEDGTFAGVVVVGVEPSFLASFNDESSLGPRDFISIRHEEGDLLVSEKGSAIRSYDQVHLEPPEYGATAGTMRMAGGRYKDNEPRILAWEKN